MDIYYMVDKYVVAHFQPTTNTMIEVTGTSQATPPIGHIASEPREHRNLNRRVDTKRNDSTAERRLARSSPQTRMRIATQQATLIVNMVRWLFLDIK
jgi:hypothetical protein